MTNIIQTENLTYAYPPDEGKDPVPALTGVDLAIEPGSFVVILGHNGSGKSTLAKHMNAVLLPTGGRVLVDGIDTAREEQLFEVRRRVGMVFQNPDNQIVANVVEEDVAFGPENIGVPTEEIRKRVDESLKAVGMEEFLLHAPHMLSGGQKQRIAIAGVIAMAPRCIVLDESTAMLDPSGRQEVLDTITWLNRERGITIVLITHHMNEAAYARRVIVMDHGQIALDGPPREILTRSEDLRRLGLTPPPTVELLASLREAGWDVPLDAIDPADCARAISEYLGA